LSFETETSDKFLNDNPVAEELDKVAVFQYSIGYTKFPVLSNPQVQNVIAQIIASGLTDRLDTSGVYAADNLRLEIDEERGITVSFGDDIYNFVLRMTDEHFVFQKRGSTLREFIDTCDLIMDTVVEIFNDISKYIRGLSGASDLEPFRFSPHTCSYKFLFGLRNFSPSGKSTRKSIPNYELMEKIVPSTQTKTSPLSGMGFDSRGRTEVSVSGTLKFSDIDWFVFVHIDSPGNRNYSTMEMDFQISSVHHDYGDGNRRPFDPRSIGEWRPVLLTFLKDTVFNTFLKQWMGDVNFESLESLSHNRV